MRTDIYEFNQKIRDSVLDMFVGDETICAIITMNRGRFYA